MRPRKSSVASSLLLGAMLALATPVAAQEKPAAEGDTLDDIHNTATIAMVMKAQNAR